MKVMIAMPSYLGRLEDVSVIPQLARPSVKYQMGFAQTSTSANCNGFNTLWIQALEFKEKQGFTHILFVHTDIVPETPLFLDKMMEIMAAKKADVLSCVVPLKTRHGLTSTALDQAMPETGVDQKWRVKRYTMKEIYKMEPTFTHEKLLVNDGLMLVDMRKDWVEKIHFHFEDAIIRHPSGKRLAVFAPEDWNFSRDARALGASIWATREIALRHMGQTSYPNTEPWGTKESDTLE